MILGRLKIGTRLSIGLATITLFMVLVILFGILGMRDVDEQMKHLIISHHKIWNANVIRDSLHNADKSLLPVILSQDERTRAFENVKIITARATYADAIEELMKLESTARGRDLLTRLQHALVAFKKDSENAIEMAMNSNPEQAVFLYLNSIRPPTLSLYQLCAELATYEKEESDTYSREAITTYRKTRYFFVLIGGIAVIIAVLGAVLLTRSIVTPLEQGVSFANKLSEGDFSAEIEIKQHDETGHLLRAMKNMAERLKKTKSLEQQLFQSQKLENVGRLAGGVAHDFNNLLTVIRGYSELALLGMAEGDPVRGSLEEVLKASERAGNLTRQLLAFSRRQVMEMKIIDLKCLMKDLEKMLRRLIGEDIDLRLVLAPDLGRVKADPGQIEQVIVNLAVNARDAMPSGGVLTIEAANVELDEGCSCQHVDAKPGEYVLLCVSDTGTGMGPEVRERIFEPFFTTKEKGKGTGLGLSMAYGIVKQSNGHIWVYSEANKGTTFKIYLPLAKEPAELAAHKKEATTIPGGRETILLVEDESSVRHLAARVLRDQGYTIHEASDGTEALHFMQGNGGENIDLLLTDVIMPKLNGKELSEHLKNINPKLRVLFTSGYTDDVIAHHGVLEDGTDFIQKPYTSAALTTKVREVLSE